MIGRGAFGKPWFPAQVAAFLATGTAPSDPGLREREDILLGHYDALLGHYGSGKGIRIARKHLAWSAFGIAGANAFRAAVNTEENPDVVKRHIAALFRGDFAHAPLREAA
jgi:tRNA-dihydrouridine synthase B